MQDEVSGARACTGAVKFPACAMPSLQSVWPYPGSQLQAFAIWGQDGEVRWPAPLEVLLVVNVGVFLLWAFGSARQMMRHFEISPGSLVRRPWTLLTATVSHSDLYSLVGNLQACPQPPLLTSVYLVSITVGVGATSAASLLDGTSLVDKLCSGE